MALQVFIVPRNQRMTSQHCKLKLSHMAAAAAYEPSSRVLALLFATPGAPFVKIGFLVFDAELQRLSKAAEQTLDVPADSFVDQELALKETASMPFVLLPQQSAVTADGAGASNKV